MLIVENNVLTIHGPGEVMIQAYQAGNDAYLATDTIEQTFCIIPAKPIISGTTQERANNSDFQLRYGQLLVPGQCAHPW